MHSGLFINFFRTHFATMETLVFAIIIFGLWVLELVIAEQPWKRKLQHTTANALFVTTALPIQIFMFVFLMAMASWVKANHWGLIQFIPGHRQIVVRYIALFFMMDFFEYIYHRCMHGMPTLWKFHLVHHSDRILDVSTTVREHPVETIVRNAFMILWVFICGTNFGVILIRQIVQSFADIFAHTNLQLPP
ncbi:MAG: sterol desaturase family protein, partial [Bdellovibrionota bacterium]